MKRSEQMPEAMSAEDMRKEESLNEQDWRRLSRTVQSGNCILLLGPGVAVNPHDEGRTPLTTLLARSLSEKLLRRLGPDSQIVNPDDLTHVAEVFVHQPGWDRYDLELDVADFYAQYAEETTSLHRELVELPFTLCVTTTPDSFLPTAFRRAGKTPSVEYYHYRKPRNVRLPDPDPRNPLVFGLYGDPRPGDTRDLSSLVITESELLEFLVNVISKIPPLPSFLTARFSDPNVSILFLGFGFDQWHVRILLHVLQAQGHRFRSLALEGPGFFQHPGQRDAVVFFERGRIAIKRLSWEGFVRELKQRHHALVGAGLASAPAPPEEPPQLFLCHVHDDKEAVARIGEKLQSLGLGVWIDREELRGGDEWDRLIPKVLSEVDYVVVVQSPRLQMRVESYVYKEVRIALERQQRIASGYRFIIPANLEPCKGLSELTHLQFVDLSTPDGFRTLANAVLADWNRRHAAPEFENS